MNPVKIRISNNLLTPSCTERFDGVVDLIALTFAGNKFVSTEPVKWRVSVVNGGEGFLFVEGKVKATLKTECVRCLEDAFFEVDSEIEGYAKLKEDVKLPADVEEDECVFVHNNVIDISRFIEGAVCLDLPMQPLCSENCEGLFEFCDHDELNEEPLQTPFEVLKNYEF